VRGRATRVLAEAGRPHLATAGGTGRQPSVPVRRQGKALPAPLTNGDPSGARDDLTESSAGHPNSA
jgi:hypothetical protein